MIYPVLAAAPTKDRTFDATPMLGGDMGTVASERTMAWLATRLPDLKFLVLLKSPADRFMSNPLAAKKLERFRGYQAGAEVFGESPFKNRSHI